MSSPRELSSVCILTPRRFIHTLKLALEHHGYFRKKAHIQEISSEAEFSEYITLDGFNFLDKLYAIPTTLTVPSTTVPETRACLTLMAENLSTISTLETLAPSIVFAVHHPQVRLPIEPTLPPVEPKALLARLVQQWLHHLPPSILATLPHHLYSTLARPSWTYTVYPPLLLLPSPSPSPKADSWPWLLSAPLAPFISILYDSICESLHVTHIALNAPIPLLRSSSSAVADAEGENILRAPLALTPLRGSFGVLTPPSPAAFAAAFWVSTRQHGIYQTWAPLYTMFSRGNISEKARILLLPSLTPQRLGYPPAESSAVDLYAGIGYFAFCYARAGVGRVLCWEINGWSVEGLRRGAGANGWAVRIAGDKGAMGEEEGARGERLVVFQEDNQNAHARMEELRSRIPPVRHVNCGFLPSSAASWPVAVAVLDPLQGGWIHAHENIAVTEIERRREGIVQEFHALANPDANHPHRTVQCQQVQRVKSYAPGVMHCVLDIYITPIPTDANATPTPAMPEAPSKCRAQST